MNVSDEIERLSRENCEPILALKLSIIAALVRGQERALEEIRRDAEEDMALALAGVDCAGRA